MIFLHAKFEFSLSRHLLEAGDLEAYSIAQKPAFLRDFNTGDWYTMHLGNRYPYFSNKFLSPEIFPPSFPDPYKQLC